MKDGAVVNIGLLATPKGKVPKTGSGMKELLLEKDAGILFENGWITEIGPSREIEKNIGGGEVIDAQGKLVTPGMVDSHTHLVFGGSRERELVWKLEGLSYREIADRGGGILSTVEATRKATEKELFQTAKRRTLNMMVHGTTTVEAKSGYGLERKAELKCLRVAAKLRRELPLDVVSTFLMAHAFPPEHSLDHEGYVEEVLKVTDEVAERGLSDFIDVFMDEGYFSFEEAKTILTRGMERGMGGKLHCDELADLDGALLAGEMGLKSAEHLLLSNEKGLQRMADAGVCAVLLPGTPFALRMKEYAPARKMMELGVPVALATDLNPNCYMHSMQNAGDLAVYNMGMTPAEVLTASTLNSACAIGMSSVVGSLEVGKKADIVVWNVGKVEEMNYHFGTNKVSKVVKEGNHVVDMGNIVRS